MMCWVWVCFLFSSLRQMDHKDCKRIERQGEGRKKTHERVLLRPFLATYAISSRSVSIPFSHERLSKCASLPCLCVSGQQHRLSKFLNADPLCSQEFKIMPKKRKMKYINQQNVNAKPQDRVNVFNKQTKKTTHRKMHPPASTCNKQLTQIV